MALLVVLPRFTMYRIGSPIRLFLLLTLGVDLWAYGVVTASLYFARTICGLRRFVSTGPRLYI